MKNLLLSIFLAFGLMAHAQNDSASAKAWAWSGLYSASMTQTSLSNWAAGGNNNININGLLKQMGVYTKGHWTWSNLLEANFGYNFQPNLNNKTDDRLEFTSRVDRQFAESKWSTSAFANFRTQFADGFSKPEDTVRISTFMAPAYLTYGLGATYKPRKGFSVYVSPVTVKQTIVLDETLSANNQFYDRAAPNVGSLSNGGTYRTEMGGYLDLIYNKSFSPNLEVATKLNLFSNFLDKPQNIDVNWETILLMKVYSYLTVSLQLQLMYDHDINVRYAGGIETPDGAFNAPGTQFKQILGVGVAYTFGAYKK